MVRSFDHAGYYETRLILVAVAVGIAAYRALHGRDYRYLVMFCSGVFFQALLEFTLWLRSMRGAGYSLSVFGATLSPTVAILYQGFVEGGILSLMGFWFTDLRVSAADNRGWRRAYLGVCGLILVLAFVVGSVAAHRPISSPRPLFTPASIVLLALTVAVALLLVRWKGQGGLRYLGYFYLGCLVYVILNFEPMHIMGARFIAVRSADGQFIAASPPFQVAVMAWSHLFEVVGGKLHYFAVPFALGLLKFPGARP